MQYRNLLATMILFIAGSANASTIFAPTDGDVNFLFSTLPQGTTLAMFDDSDTTFSGSSLALSTPDLATITPSGTGPGDFTATNTALSTLNLSGSDHFILAISNDGGLTWFGDTGVIFLGSNAYVVEFSNGNVLEVDVKVVPIPAAIWLFGSSLLAFFGFARYEHGVSA